MEPEKSQEPGTIDRVVQKIGFRIKGGKFKKLAQDMLESENLQAKSVLESLGGIRGMIETLVPGVVFLICYAVTQDARISALAPIGVAVLFILIRFIRKEKIMPAVYGLFSVFICALFAVVSGRGENYYLPGFYGGASAIFVFILSLVFRFPAIGFVAAVLLGRYTTWRKDKRFYQAGVMATLLWLAMYVVRLAVQLPLYFLGEVEALGIAKLVLGPPLLAIVLVVSWLLFLPISRSK